MEVAWCGRRGRETEQQCGRSHERQVRDAGGGAPGSWRKKEAMCLCLHDVSGDPSTSHFGGVLVVAESRLQGVGKEMGRKQQRQKTQYSFYKFGRKDKDKLGF